jgi:probable HAF family extracellular repeat protein
MKSRLLLTSTLLGLLALLAAPASSTAQEKTTAKGRRQSNPRYKVIDLGTLGGPGTNSSAYDMNNIGWVAGSGNLAPNGPQHAFLWYGRGPLVDLGTLGGPNSEAGGPNMRGEAALISETAETDPNGEDFCGFGNHLQCLAATWRNEKMTALSTLPGGHNAQAYGLNNLGQVIGFSETGVRDPSCGTLMPFQSFRYEAALWEPNGKVRKLSPLPGDTVGFAFGINNFGQAVGTSSLCENSSLPPVAPHGTHAVLWERDGSAIDLGNLGGTDPSAPDIANSINNFGEIAGVSQSTDGTVHPFLWTRRKGMQDLGTFPGAVATINPCCNTINDSGQVVGFSIDSAGNLRAFLWQNGVLADLNSLIPKNSSMYLLGASAINDVGEITGFGIQLSTGELHAFLAKPR